MGIRYTFDSDLGTRFREDRRAFSLLSWTKFRSAYSVFLKEDKKPITDIYSIDADAVRSNVAYAEPVDLDIPFNEETVKNPLLSFFKDGFMKQGRPGNSGFSLMGYEATNPYYPPFPESEYSKLTNGNNRAESNMERIITDNFKSFIPVDIGKSFLNEAIAYYQTVFGKLPNEYYTIDYSERHMYLKLKQSMENIEKTFDIRHKFAFRSGNNKKSEIEEVNYILEDGVLLFLSAPFNAAIVIYDCKEQLDKILPHIAVKKERKTAERPRFKLLVHSQYGFSVEEFDLKHFDVNVADNYNDDLPDKKIRDFIESESEAGLCILHGKPGTGKTYYIRDLIKKSKKEFIYMNKECLNYINDSSFIAFLIKSKNSVFIMEDCENVLASRTDYNNTISTLLNLSDGLLGDSLNNKFVCTFNTDISNIDDALLRKGRMKVCYEFKYLKPDKANALAEKLNKSAQFDKEVPLCDVMNSESNGNEDIPSKKHKTIGF